ncbi:MAG: universal stress protein [Spirochaetia bacterium]|jgi:nucleotide-binding universal stress UspA family protein|nr:universal stress protein [Spirochaetia bacterium]
MKIKKIMVPVDDSSYSFDAVQYSIDYAKSMECEILLIHCHKQFPTAIGEPFLQKAIDKILENANDVLAPYRDVYKENNVPFKELLLEEPAGKVISETAEIEGINLIIMGSRGKSDLAGLILGSTTHKVLHTAPCPVLVVR